MSRVGTARIQTISWVIIPEQACGGGLAGGGWLIRRALCGIDTFISTCLRRSPSAAQVVQLALHVLSRRRACVGTAALAGSCACMRVASVALPPVPSSYLKDSALSCGHLLGEVFLDLVASSKLGPSWATMGPKSMRLGPILPSLAQHRTHRTNPRWHPAIVAEATSLQKAIGRQRDEL